MVTAAPAHHVEGDQPDRQSVQYGLHGPKPERAPPGKIRDMAQESPEVGAKYPRPGSRYPRLSGKEPFLARELFLRASPQCPSAHRLAPERIEPREEPFAGEFLSGPSCRWSDTPRLPGYYAAEARAVNDREELA